MLLAYKDESIERSNYEYVKRILPRIKYSVHFLSSSNDFRVNFFDVGNFGHV